jgi:hypothetical protein
MSIKFMYTVPYSGVLLVIILVIIYEYDVLLLIKQYHDFPDSCVKGTVPRKSVWDYDWDQTKVRLQFFFKFSKSVISRIRFLKEGGFRCKTSPFKAASNMD